jgi:hypothetical protein
LFFVVLLIALAVSPFASFGNNSWSGFHWARTNNPFTLKLGDNVSSSWNSYLQTTSADWSRSTVLNTEIVAGSGKPRSCRPTSGQVEVCDANYGNTGWLGVAQIWITGGTHITQGTVKLNDTYFSSPQYDTPGWRNLVSCQEVGHTLGLDHQDTNFNNKNLGTCMDYTSNPYGPPDNEHPDTHDYNELVTIYSHLDNTTTVGQTKHQMPSAMADVDYDTPERWGKVIKGSRESGTSVHELDFGGGNRIFTFVLWTRNAKDHNE